MITNDTKVKDQTSDKSAQKVDVKPAEAEVKKEAVAKASEEKKTV